MIGAPIEWALAAFFFVLGLVFGSFANVLIARLPEGESIAFPGSRCPHCQAPIRWYDNVPLISWILLRARCRHCKAPISARYPLVEFLTGLLFLAMYRRFGLTPPLLSGVLFAAFLVPLTWIDLDHWILPFELTLPGIAVGLLSAIPQGLEHLRDCAIGAAGGFFLFWGLEKVGRFVFRKEALGEGDKYLLALLGAFVTYRPMLGVVLLSSLQGSVVGLALLALRGRAGPAPVPAPPAGETPTDKPGEDEEDDWVPGPTNIPFGPWLALSGLEVMLIGPWLSSVLPPQFGWMLLGTLPLSS